MNGSTGLEMFENMLLARTTRQKALRAQLEALDQEIQSIEHSRQLYMNDHGIETLRPSPLFDQGLSLTKRR